MEIHRSIIQRLLTLLVTVCLCVMAEAGPIGISAKELKAIQEKVKMAREDTSKAQSELWEKAREAIEQALSRDANNPELNYLYGVYYYYGKKDVKTARYRYLKAINASEHHFKARQEMIRVEEGLKNYSSAICYINELLEYQPYDRELWERKISLYRKLGNMAEADDLRMRLAHIYNNDDTLRNFRNNQWNRMLMKNERVIKVDSLELKIEENKQEPKYDDYNQLTELYTSLGEYDKAIETAMRYLSKSKNLTATERRAMTRKAASLMVNLGRYAQAQEFVVDRRQLYHADRSFQDSVMILIAEHTRMNDPYEANARLYEKTGNRDALDYLTNTAISRGYYDDALVYIKKRYGNDSTEMLKRQYGLEIRMGHQQAAQNTLMKLYRRNADTSKLRNDYIDAFQQLSNSDIVNGQWQDAEKDLRELYKLLGDTIENEYWPSMMTRRITTYGHLGQFEVADSIHQYAVGLDPLHRGQYDSAYEELMVRRIRDLVEEEHHDSALQVSKNLLERMPNSSAALRNCINLSQLLNDNTLFYEHAKKGYENNKCEPYYTNKYVVALQQQRKYDDALLMLDSCIQTQRIPNPQLIATYSGITYLWATQQMDTLRKLPEKEKYDHPDSIWDEYKTIISRIEKALKRDSINQELQFVRATAYERIHQWDSAFLYQQRYWNPSVAEQREYYQHTDYLQYKSFRERVDISYTHAFYDTHEGNLASTGHLYSIATVAYTHLADSNTYTGQVSYKGIDGYHNASGHEAGGAGIEMMLQWEHQFPGHWSGMFSASWSNRYFSKWGANASMSYAANRGWTPSLRLGYRRTPETYLYLDANNRELAENEKYHLFLVTPSIEKSWERVRATLTTDMALMKSGFYYNVGLKSKLFFKEDNVSSVSLISGFGTFPELTFFEQTALQNVSHTNSMVGFDAQILCSSRLTVGLSGSWNTCYDPYWNTDGTLSDSYRNIYTLCAQLHVAF